MAASPMHGADTRHTRPLDALPPLKRRRTSSDSPLFTVEHVTPEGVQPDASSPPPPEAAPIAQPPPPPAPPAQSPTLDASSSESEAPSRPPSPAVPALQDSFEPAPSGPRAASHAALSATLASILLRALRVNDVSRFIAPGSDPPQYRSQRYPDGSSTLFFSLRAPAFPLRDYVSRFVTYLGVSRSVFVVALIYLDRVRGADEMLALTELNVHRLFTTAVALAVKFLEDMPHGNATLRNIGGVPSTAEMNMLELQFLRRLSWDCSVSQTTYKLYESRIVLAQEVTLNEQVPV